MNTEPVMAPCPFCADRGPELTSDGHGYYVACTAGSDCTARGPRRDTADDAVCAWNAAAAEPLGDQSAPPADPPEGDGSDSWNCGNRWLRAERTLRLVEHVRANRTADIEHLDGLIYEAGPKQAREWLGRQDEVPF